MTYDVIGKIKAIRSVATEGVSGNTITVLHRTGGAKLSLGTAGVSLQGLGSP